jgi:hypothetical protein
MDRVDRDQLVMGLSAVFAGLTTVLLVLTLAARQPLLLAVAVPFGATTFFMWYQASGRLEEKFRERTTRGRTRRRTADGGFGAGARRAAREARSERFVGPGADARGRTRTRTGGTRRPGTGGDTGLSRAEAYDALGLDADGDADEAAVKRAYRDRVKEVHPDRGGDEDAFKRVNRAYETLTDAEA